MVYSLSLFQVFPDAIVWSNNVNGERYDLVLLGGTVKLRPMLRD